MNAPTFGYGRIVAAPQPRTVYAVPQWPLASQGPQSPRSAYPQLSEQQPSNQAMSAMGGSSFSSGHSSGYNAAPPPYWAAATPIERQVTAPGSTAVRGMTPRRATRNVSPGPATRLTADDVAVLGKLDPWANEASSAAATTRAVATPCRVQPPTSSTPRAQTPRRGNAPPTPRGGPCRSPMTPRGGGAAQRSVTPCRGGAWSPPPGGAVASSAVAPLGASISGTPNTVPCIAGPPNSVAFHCTAGSGQVPVGPAVPVAAIPEATRGSPRRSASREDSRSPPCEFQKLYDEDWWYRHLEERRRGGAPPDSFISGDGQESVPVPPMKADWEGFAPQMPSQGSGRTAMIGAPGIQIAAPDVAAGGPQLCGPPPSWCHKGGM